jgi:hypothetical protein
MKNLTKSGNIKLYFHETSGGAKYLFDTAAEIYDRHYDYFRNIIDSHKITG